MTRLFQSARHRAAQLYVKPGRVIHWIHTGQLRAIDVSERKGGRPRWRISPEALQEFLAARSNRKPAKATRRRKAPLPLVDFFPAKAGAAE